MSLKNKLIEDIGQCCSPIRWQGIVIIIIIIAILIGVIKKKNVNKNKNAG